MASTLGPLTFGITIKLHVPVLRAPDSDPIRSVLDFPADEWYKRNCLFYNPGGRKIPVVRDDVKVDKKARNVVWGKLIDLFKDTIEKPEGSSRDLEVVATNIKFPKETFESDDRGRYLPTCASGVGPEQDHFLLGNFVDGHYSAYDRWIVCKDENGCWYQGGDGELFRAWKQPPIGPEQYSWFSIEIKSKVYSDINAMGQDLQKVCWRIRSRFLVSINCGRGSSRTSTHVHVGRSGSYPVSESLPFGLSTVKRIATVMHVLEPLWTEMHAPWKGKDYRHTALLSGYTHLGKFCAPSVKFDGDDLPLDTGYRPENFAYGQGDFILTNLQRLGMKNSLQKWYRRENAALEMIWGSKDMAQLAWLLSCREGTRPGAFALHDLVPTENGVIKSRYLHKIEFRHMHGSLDVIDIMNWVRIVGRVTSVCLSNSADQFFASEVGTLLGRDGVDITVLTLGLCLAVKLKQQLLQETSLPKAPDGEMDEKKKWSSMKSQMFVKGVTPSMTRWC
ncbi:hypothetical protein GGR54DRAFT_511681 [Hypoxylon sp. NC1633]|nr:hypothetical protein GGR54DRAFT_511681 [Hypoxylon sp. NC1633]